MNSVKFGQRSGRFKAIEETMIEALKEKGFLNVYPQTKRFNICHLVEDLEEETRLKIGFEEIEFSTLKFNPRSNSFVMEPELIGYKIFLK